MLVYHRYTNANCDPCRIVTRFDTIPTTKLSNERKNKNWYSLAPLPSKELPEEDQRQLWIAWRTPAPAFYFRDFLILNWSSYLSDSKDKSMELKVLARSEYSFCQNLNGQNDSNIHANNRHVILQFKIKIHLSETTVLEQRQSLT